MTNRELYATFADRMGFISVQAASILKFGDTNPKHISNVATELLAMVGYYHGNTKFKRMRTSLSKALYGFSDEKNPNRHNLINNILAARHAFNSHIPHSKNPWNADFHNQERNLLFETHLGSETYEGTRQVKDKFIKYPDDAFVIWFCTAKMSIAPQDEQRECQKIHKKKN